MRTSSISTGTLKITENRQLADLTTFGIGGPARKFVTVGSVEEMQEALLFAKREALRFFVLGKGSNSLFDDRGFDGLVILNKIGCFELDRGAVRVGAGYPFSLLGIKTARAGWSGLEFASGIPGTVGGAVVMNAGANGQETADVLTSVEVVTAEGERQRFSREELAYSYRTSPFQKMSAAVVGATFQLEASEEARSKQISLIDYRKETQPLQEKSAGCMFRNPSNGSAGSLIEKSGLKGLSVGGAMVSDVHANFVINRGGATAADVCELIEIVRQRVQEKTGIVLEEEVKRIEI